MTDLLQYTFFQNALIGLAIISVAAAVIGTYVIARRMVSIAGGVTHACFGGLGLGYYLGFNPIIMAGAVAVGSALGVEWMSARGRMREDSAIAVVWGVGMAIGVLFVFLTPGYVPELNSFLFGNILTITPADLLTFGIFTVALLAVVVLLRNQIIACAFDSDFARVSGLPVRFINSMMTVLVAIGVVLTIRLVGVMLLMSMFTLPQLIAELYTKRLEGIMALSVAVSLVTSLSGLVMSTVIEVPCSALIVLTMAAAYLVLRIIPQIIRLIARR